MNDPRPRELLEEDGRRAARLGLAIAWTNGIQGAAAKECSRSGSAAWKAAKVLPDEAFAAAFFAQRARTRNPVCAASASRLVLVEIDLDVPDDATPDLAEMEPRVAALLSRLGLQFPTTVTVKSRRGIHVYFRPEDGCQPVKVQISEKDGSVAWIGDGYLVLPPALHQVGIPYEYVRNGSIATLPAETYQQLQALGQEEQAETHRRLELGEPLPVGSRNDGLFHEALGLVRDGVPEAEALERLRQVNRALCQPPLDDGLVLKAHRGAVTWAAKHPTETVLARAEAQRILEDLHEGRQEPRQPRDRAQAPLIVSLVEFLGGSEDDAAWLVDHLAARGALVVVAGLPKVGKSTFVYGLLGALTSDRDRFIGLPAGSTSALLMTEEPPATVEEKVDRFGIDDERVFVISKRKMGAGRTWPKTIAEVVAFCRARPEVGDLRRRHLGQVRRPVLVEVGDRHRDDRRDDRAALRAARARRLRDPDHPSAQGGGRRTGCASGAAPP